ncbi:MAG: trimethylamine methyltransferase family protein [Bacillota bacterium]|jgi:trimethylamine--corrinoid protein Co-methyltransferase
MTQKYDVLTQEEVLKIHDHSMRILEEVGVEFTYDPAIKVFTDAGFKVEGHKVFFKREDVEALAAKAPAEFTLSARDPKKTAKCNQVDLNLTPAYGPPYIYDLKGERRYSNMEDYDNIIKLTQMSENINHTGGNVCEPIEVPEEYRHLKMLYSHIKYSDKPFMGSAYGVVGASDSVKMAEMIFGGREQIKKNPVLITLINSITPLKYDDRMLGALMTYAEAGQACLISSLVMSGSTGPVAMAATIALQMAEILAGVCLAQLINPGTPCIMGSTSGACDMRAMSLSIGSAETALYTAATAQMARYYGMPSRGGGGLNDAKVVDAQAGYESMLTLFAAASSGINYVLHAAGIMQYYTSFSYEKFIIDDEIAGLVRKFMKGFDFADDKFLMDDIAQVGPGGHFLYQPSTFALCREELRDVYVSDRGNWQDWDAAGRKTVAEAACAKWQDLLTKYEAPEMDEALDKELCDFVAKRSAELTK